MKCENHSEKDLIGTCERCRNSYCSECLVNVGGKMNCRDCLKDTPLPSYNSEYGNNYHKKNQYTQPVNDGNQTIALLLLIFFPLFGVIYTLIAKPFGKTGQNIVIWVFVIFPIILFLLIMLFMTVGYATYN